MKEVALFLIVLTLLAGTPFVILGLKRRSDYTLLYGGAFWTAAYMAYVLFYP
ncbi:hypothetical protein P4V43_25580 [Brevibacillus fortis]|uniref:hypothetical protein n=1 Tax=Brevibacillus fortis TaxID=2126352 RepID=UPI002E20B017|nr:hypothetical protein [Brevibacillus fortis]